MADQRAPFRHKKRISVMFGVDEPCRVAFTEDVSAQGLFIKSMNVCPPNTKVKVQFLLEDKHKVLLEARVMWAKKVPQNLFHLVKKSGMGLRILRFHSGEEYFRNFCEQMALPR